MRVDTIRLSNFRCFAERTFELAGRFNLLIGDNGKGKTSVLEGLAAGLGALLRRFPSPAKSRPVRQDDVRRNYYRHGDITTAEPQFPVVVSCQGEVFGESGQWSRELTGLDKRTTRETAMWLHKLADRASERVKRGEAVTLPVISYYGTGRLWVQVGKRQLETLGAQSRFMGYRDCLDPASDEKRLLEWFKTQEIAAIQRREPISTIEACRHAILACVPDATHVYFDVAEDQLMLLFGEAAQPFYHLSDGYRNMLAMVADIAVRAATLNPALEGRAALETPGVVLIDEIDLHLHPKWQRRAVGDLLRAFPRMQFVATTHSPFIIQSLPPRGDVRLLNLDDPTATGYADMSVEDITEDVQGVELPQRSRRFLEMMEAAEKYYALLRDADSQSADQRERLRQRLDELTLPFSDDPAYQALLRSQRAASGLEQGAN